MTMSTPDESVHVRPLRAEDAAWVQPLYAANSRDALTPEQRAAMYGWYAPDPRMRANVGIRRRLAPLLDNSRPEIELIHALVLSLPGSPCLYYGDELGLTGVKEDRLGGDDASRPALPGSPTDVDGVDERVLELYRRLIAFRRRTPWLTDATIATSDVA